MDTLFADWRSKLKQRPYFYRRRKWQGRRRSYNGYRYYRHYEDRNRTASCRSTEEPRYDVLHDIHWLDQTVET